MSTVLASSGFDLSTNDKAVKNVPVGPSGGRNDTHENIKGHCYPSEFDPIGFRADPVDLKAYEYNYQRLSTTLPTASEALIDHVAGLHHQHLDHYCCTLHVPSQDDVLDGPQSVYYSDPHHLWSIIKRILSGPSRPCILLMMMLVAVGGSLVFYFITTTPRTEVIELPAPPLEMPVQPDGETYDDQFENTFPPKQFPQSSPHSTALLTTKFPVDELSVTPVNNEDQIPVHHHNHIHCEHNVTSVADLQALGTICDTVIVERLVEDISRFSHVSIVNTGNVHNLKIVGPVSAPWLKVLLIQFSKIENLTLNLQQLCSVIPDKKLMPNPTTASGTNTPGLTNLQALFVREAISDCGLGLLSNIMGWRIPKIKILNFEHCSLTAEAYEPVHNFMQRHNESLSLISVRKSFLCPTCTYTDVSFRRLENFEVLDSVDKTLLSTVQT